MADPISDNNSSTANTSTSSVSVTASPSARSTRVPSADPRRPSPRPSGQPTAAPTVRPTNRETPAPSPSAAQTGGGGQTAASAPETFYRFTVSYTNSLNCTGVSWDSSTPPTAPAYNVTLNPLLISADGKCLNQSDLYLAATSFPGGAIPGNSFTVALVDGKLPPPLVIDGYVTTYYADPGQCQSASNFSFQAVQLTDTCVPSISPEAQYQYAGMTSIKIVNNHLWLTKLSYTSALCKGGTKRVYSLPSVTCLQLPRILDATNTCSDQLLFRSYHVSSPPPPLISHLLSGAVAMYDIKTLVASLSVALGLAMVLLLLHLGKWTNYNIVIFISAVLQLGYDLTLLSTPPYDKQQALVHSAIVIDSDARSAFALEFFYGAFSLAVCLNANFITFIVAYIFLYSKVFVVQDYVVSVVAGIVTISVTLPLLQTLRRNDLFRQNLGQPPLLGSTSSNIDLTFLEQGVQIIKLVSVAANVAVIAFIWIRITDFKEARASVAASFSSRSSEPQNMNENRNTQAQALKELVNRLWMYPIIIFATQLPVFWDDFAYSPHQTFDEGSVRSAHTTSINGDNLSFLSDDAFYKTQAYQACWFLHSLLVPSAGGLFAIYYFWTLPDVRQATQLLLWILFAVPPKSLSLSEAAPVDEILELGVERESSSDPTSSSAGLVAAVDDNSSDLISKSKAWQAMLAAQGFRVAQTLSPVFAAIASNDEEKLKLVLSEKPWDGKEVNGHGKSAAVVAAEEGKLGCLKVLASQGANLTLGGSSAQAALLQGHMACVEFLYSLGVELVDGVVQLHVFASLGRVDDIKRLLEVGEDKDICDAQGRRATHWACKFNQVAALNALLRAGADIDARDKKGATAAHVSAAFDSVGCLKKLRDYGADCNVLDEEGDTPAFKALMLSKWQAFIHLDTVGAVLSDVNKCDDEGRSASYLAAKAGNSEFLEKLVKKYDALYLSRRAGLLSAEDKAYRFGIFAGIAIILIATVASVTSSTASDCKTFFVDSSNGQGIVLTPYIVLGGGVFVFKLFQHFFEETLLPLINFLRFYVEKKSLGTLAADIMIEKQQEASRGGEQAAAARPRASQFSLDHVYTRDDIPDQTAESPMSKLSNASRISLDTRDSLGASIELPPWNRVSRSLGEGRASSASRGASSNSRPVSILTSSQDVSQRASLFQRAVNYRTWAFLVGRLDQDVVKGWRLKKYRSSAKGDPEYRGDDVWCQSSFIFLYLQIFSLVASVIVAFTQIDARVPAWEQYQNFYGLVVNSGLATVTFSLIKMHADGRGEQIASLSSHNQLFIFLPLAILLPPLLTHIVPMIVSYFWMVLPALVLLRLGLAVRDGSLKLQSLEQSALVAGIRARLSPRLRRYLLTFAAEISIRFLFIFLVLTMYDFAAILYSLPEPVGPSAYSHVITTDVELRSQHACFLQNKLDLHHLLLLFSFF